MDVTLIVIKAFECPHLINEEDFEKLYDSDPNKLWKFFTDSGEDVFDFCQDSGQVISIESQIEKSAYNRIKAKEDKRFSNESQ